MSLTYDHAQALTLTAMVIVWIPTLTDISVLSSVVIWIVAFAMMGVPLAYDKKYGLSL